MLCSSKKEETEWERKFNTFPKAIRGWNSGPCGTGIAPPSKLPKVSLKAGLLVPSALTGQQQNKQTGETWKNWGPPTTTSFAKWWFSRVLNQISRGKTNTRTPFRRLCTEVWDSLCLLYSYTSEVYKIRFPRDSTLTSVVPCSGETLTWRGLERMVCEILEAHLWA